MESKKIRELAPEELKAEQVKLAEQLFRLKFAKSLGKQEGVARITSLKRDVARMNTIMRERARAAQKAGK